MPVPERLFVHVSGDVTCQLFRSRFGRRNAFPCEYKLFCFLKAYQPRKCIGSPRSGISPHVYSAMPNFASSDATIMSAWRRCRSLLRPRRSRRQWSACTYPQTVSPMVQTLSCRDTLRLHQNLLRNPSGLPACTECFLSGKNHCPYRLISFPLLMSRRRALQRGDFQERSSTRGIHPDDRLSGSLRSSIFFIY